jgi:putative SOS response-associated peptidase YedK
MCGRYTLRHVDEIQLRFLIEDDVAGVTPRYNVAPTQSMPVITYQNGKNQVEWMKWGLVPSWSKDPQPAYATINARAEGIEARPAYRQPLSKQRCLIPCDGFYEWVQAGKQKQPYFIHLHDDALFAFAGLYDIYHLPDGDLLKTFTIITVPANDLIMPLHPRMDVILFPEDEARWLDPSVTDPRELSHYFYSYPSELMELYPVSTQVNSPRNDVPQLIAPLPDDAKGFMPPPTQGSLF